MKEGEIILYTTEDGAARIQLRAADGTVWLTQLEMAELFATTKQNISLPVQSKMHWAAHGHTAAEIIHQRADATKPHMGLLTFEGSRPRKADVAIAKNYLSDAEIEPLNRIVNLYLEFAELQPLNRREMTMAGWIDKLDQFLQISDRPILRHAGKISADTARAKAEAEFDRFRALLDLEPSPVEKHYLAATAQTAPAETAGMEALDAVAKKLAKQQPKRKGGAK